MPGMKWAIIFMSGRKKTTTLPTSTKSEEPYMLIFAKHKHIYDLYYNSGEIVNFSHDIQNELLMAYREAHDQYYNYNRTCPVCVAEFLTLIYRWYAKQF